MERQPGRTCSERRIRMQDNRKDGTGSRRRIEGLPVVRRNVAGVDLGSERHWVCAPTVEGTAREIADFGATTAELNRMGKWLQDRGVESVAMESTGLLGRAARGAGSGGVRNPGGGHAATGAGAGARPEDRSHRR